MAKRLTDTDKWKDDWYVSLSNDSKVVWQWLLDNCNHAGICKRSIGLLNVMCKVNYTEEKMIEEMDRRVIVIGNIWFIPKFIKFQYTTLLSGKPAVVSVVKELFSANLIGVIPESFGNDYSIISKSFDNHCKMIKDKDKDTVKDKDKDRKGVIGENLKGVKFSNDMLSVIFQDGSSQKLGTEQCRLLDMGQLKPKDVTKGLIN